MRQQGGGRPGGEHPGRCFPAPGKGVPGPGHEQGAGWGRIGAGSWERCVCGQGKLKAKEVWWNNVLGDGMGTQHLQTIPEAGSRQQKAPVR